MANWNIIFARGATYEQTIEVVGIEGIATATLWRVRCAMPTQLPFLEATTASGQIVGTISPNIKTLLIDPSDTAAFPLGNGRFDFEIEWNGGTEVKRLVANSRVQVIPQTGDDS